MITNVELKPSAHIAYDPVTGFQSYKKDHNLSLQEVTDLIYNPVTGFQSYKKEYFHLIKQ